MKVVTIGATGFIGRHVIAQLLEGGHEVAVVHRGNSRLAQRPGLAEILGDRSQVTELRGRFQQWAPDVALDMILSSAAHAQATVNAFRGIARHLVAISSADVYRAMAIVHRLESGPLEPVPLREDSALRTTPQTYSPEALAAVRSVFPWVDADYDKVQVERVIGSDPHLRGTILRLPMVYGPGDPLHRLYPLLKRMDDRRPAILLEDAFARFVPCRGYVENVAGAIVLAVTAEAPSTRIYNVAEPDPYTEAEWTAKVAAAAGWNGRVVALHRDRMPQHLLLPYNAEQHLYTDSTRIRQELGYAERVPVDQALRRTVAWERANPPEKVDPAQYDYAAEDAALA